MSNPPEQPPRYPPPGNPAEPATQPLDPAAQRGAPYRAEPYAADPRPAAANYWRLEGLRTALTIVGLIAIIAAGLAVWALVRSERNRHTTSGTPATIAAMNRLTDRVNGLQATVHSLSSSGSSHGASTRSLTAQLSALQQSEKQLSSRIGHPGNSAQVAQLVSKESALSAKVSQLTGKEAQLSGQVSQLQGRVASLAGQVSQLKGQSTQTSTTGTGTTP